MPGGLGVSTTDYSRPRPSFLLFFDHQTGHAARFNARGLLYECVFDVLLFFLHRFDLLEGYFF